MGILLKVIMAKISQQNRKFFLKWLPFNFCDQNCERCAEFQNVCKIYQEEVQFKMECLRTGKDPNDLKVVFEQVGKSLAQTMALVMKELEKQGIELTQEDEDEYFKEEARKEKIIHNHALYKKSWKLMDDIRNFFDEFHSSFGSTSELVLNTLVKDFKEIVFYFHPIFIKAARALHSQSDNLDETIKFSRPDWMVSGALSYYSLLTVERSLVNIRETLRGSQDIWVLRINTILKDMSKIRKIYLKTFPGLEKYKTKIIFHGNY